MITRECDRCGGEAHPEDVPVCGNCRAIALRFERQRTDAAQAEVARRGDVMLAALLANVVRPPLPSPAQVAQYQPGPAPERRPAEVTIGGRGVVGRIAS